MALPPAVRPEDSTLADLVARVRKLAAAGLPEHKIALALGFDSPRALARVPALAQAYLDEHVSRLSKAGKAILDAAEGGDVKAQTFILQTEGQWADREPAPSPRELRAEVEALDGLPDSGSALAQLQAAALAEYNLAPPGSEAAEKAFRRALDATAAREKLDAPAAQEAALPDLTPARASSEYMRLRTSYGHLTDDMLPPDVIRHLDWLRARMNGPDKS